MKNILRYAVLGSLLLATGSTRAGNSLPSTVIPTEMVVTARPTPEIREQAQERKDLINGYDEYIQKLESTTRMDRFQLEETVQSLSRLGREVDKHSDIVGRHPDPVMRALSLGIEDALDLLAKAQDQIHSGKDPGAAIEVAEVLREGLRNAKRAEMVELTQPTHSFNPLYGRTNHELNGHLEEKKERYKQKLDALSKKRSSKSGKK